MSDFLRPNPRDTLPRAGPEQQRELFKAFSKVATGFSMEEVAGAAINLLVNAVRQTHPTRRVALDSLERYLTQARVILTDNYYVTGARRPNFAFDQMIEMPLFDARKKDEL